MQTNPRPTSCTHARNAPEFRYASGFRDIDTYCCRQIKLNTTIASRVGISTTFLRARCSGPVYRRPAPPPGPKSSRSGRRPESESKFKTSLAPSAMKEENNRKHLPAGPSAAAGPLALIQSRVDSPMPTPFISRHAKPFMPNAPLFLSVSLSLRIKGKPESRRRPWPPPSTRFAQTRRP